MTGVFPDGVPLKPFDANEDDAVGGAIAEEEKHKEKLSFVVRKEMRLWNRAATVTSLEGASRDSSHCRFNPI
jgi:hypothetical protein